MERNVARLFRDKIKFSAAVTFSQSSILAGIAVKMLHVSCDDRCHAWQAEERGTLWMKTVGVFW